MVQHGAAVVPPDFPQAQPLLEMVAAPGHAEESYLEGAKQVNLHGGLDELLKVPIETRTIEDPETGAPTKRLRRGFFHVAVHVDVNVNLDGDINGEVV